jgi:hypothetical protein
LAGAAPEGESPPLAVLPASVSEAEKPAACGVRASFLLDGLRAGFTEIRTRGHCAPWRCTRPGSDPEDGNGPLHVLMPLREDPADELLAAAAAAVRECTEDADTTGTPAAQPQPRDEETPTVPNTAPADVPAARKAPDPSDADPAEAFRLAFETAETAVRDAAAAVRDLKSRFRLLEKDLKAREQRYARCEKAIATLQEAAGF